MSTVSTSSISSISEDSIVVDGRFIKTARLRDEYYVPVDDPTAYIEYIRSSGQRADLFSFVQEIPDRTPKFNFYQEWDRMAVLPLTTYDHWFNKQITFKPRNKIRKAQKSGLEIKVIEFNDELIAGIKSIYDESPVRQGKLNRHYGKDLATLKREHATFLERSEFIGAYFKRELIGFVKVTHAPDYSIIMNILSKVSFRERAPSNLLIDKTVEICASRKSAFLNYGIWGRRGLNDFKVANAFEQYLVPRYFVPLSLTGRLALRLKIHRPLVEYLPETWLIRAADLRAKMYQHRFHEPSQPAKDKGATSVSMRDN